jgi:hypothetical protein
MRERRLLDSKGIVVKNGDTIKENGGHEVVICIEGDRFSFRREDGSKSMSIRIPKTNKKQKFRIIKRED